jgi:hypothetical protein
MKQTIKKQTRDIIYRTEKIRTIISEQSNRDVLIRIVITRDHTNTNLTTTRDVYNRDNVIKDC